MFDVRYEWISYIDKETNQEKKFLAYYLYVGDTKIQIRGADKKDTNYNQKLLDSARTIGLIKKNEN